MIENLAKVEEALRNGTLDPNLNDAEFISVASNLLSIAYHEELDNIISCNEDLEMLAGDQWDSLDRQARIEAKKPVMQVNMLAPLVMNVTSNMAQSMPGINFSHVSNDEQTTKLIAVLNSLCRYYVMNEGSSMALRKACLNQVAAGAGHCRVVVVPSKDDPTKKEIKIVPYKFPHSVIYEPMVAGIDKQEANYLFISETISTAEIRSRYPHVDMDELSREGGTVYAPHISGSVNTHNSHVDVNGANTIIEVMYKRHFNHNFLIPADDDSAKISLLGMSNSDVAVLLQRYGGSVMTVRDYRIHGAIYAGNVVLERYEYPLKTFPVVTFTGFEVDLPNRQSRSGVVTLGKDAQRGFNYLKSAQIEILGNQTHSPWLVQEDAIAGFEEWEESNIKSNPAVLRHKPAENGEPIPPVRVQPPVLSAGVYQEMKQTETEIHKTTGVHESALGGQSSTDSSGRAVQEREAQTATTQYIYKDNFNLSYLQLIEHVAKLIPLVHTEQRIAKLFSESGEPEAKVIPALSDIMIEGLIPDIGPAYKTSRQQQSMLLQSLAHQAPDLAPSIYKYLIKNSDIANRHELLKDFQEMMGQPDPKAESEAMKNEAMANKANAEAQAISQQGGQEETNSSHPLFEE